MGDRRTTEKPLKVGKALLSLLLSVVMAVGTIPTPALAEAIDELGGEEEVVALDDQTPTEEEAEPEEAEPAEEPAEEVEALADELEPEEDISEPMTLSAEAPGETYAPGGKADNDDLLDDYAQQRIDETLPEDKREGEVEALGKPEPVGDSLEGANKVAYDLLAEQIVEVASGARTSTVFEVPVSALTEQYEWTADELGTDIALFNEESGKYYITEDAMNAALATFQPDLGAVLDALLADYPCELYWFDKTVGTETSQISLGASFDGTDWVLTLDASQAITYSFPVAQGYASGDYEVDTSQADRIEAALEDAQSVVDAHESDSVYDRLAAYKDAICDRVTYNDAAAADGVAYGDPWQLISVFDGDGSTNVVCEGYSKAFKYLCDLSKQEGGEAITVSGTMDGGTGEGPHMWNVVKMDDGRNYLVDVTNCDEGTVGHGQNSEQDKLFVAIPASGSATEGYTFTANDSDIEYTYDDKMFSTYGEDAITYSDTAYDPEAAGQDDPEDPDDQDKIDIGNSNWSCWIDFLDGDVFPHTGNPVVLSEATINGTDESTDESIFLTEGEDFVLDHFEDMNFNTIDTPIEVGKYLVVYRGIGKYKGVFKWTIAIIDTGNLANGHILLDSYDVKLRGGFASPVVSVYNSSWDLLEKNTHYEIDYLREIETYDAEADEYITTLERLVGEPTEVGTYYVRAKAIENSGYSGTITSSAFTVSEDVSTVYQITSENLDEFESLHPYENDYDITWTYTGDEYSEYGWAVTLSDESATEGNCDFIYALDAQGNVVGQYDGELGGTTINIPGPGNSFSLRLTSDGSSTEWGFKVVGISMLSEEVIVKDSYDLSNYDLALYEKTYMWSGNAINPQVDYAYDSDTSSYVYDDVYTLVYYDEELNELDEAPSDKGTYFVAARALQGSGYKNETQKAEFRIVGANDISCLDWSGY